MCVEAQEGRRGQTCERQMAAVNGKTGKERRDVPGDVKLPRCLPSSAYGDGLRESR